MDITQTTISDLKKALAAKQVSAVELAKAYLERIEKLDGKIRAYTQVTGDFALQTAAKVDAGEISGPLAGIPIALKDVLCTRFAKTTCSSKMLADFQPTYDATAVKKLLAAGAVVLGKTNMDEFAMGSSTENSAFAATTNPWDMTRVPGGSSGGSAAAVAADLCPVSLGSDTGGSIRQPAAFCGVVGLKPSYSRVSRFGLVAYASSLDQIGPFAHCVEDAAELLAVIAGSDCLDSTCAERPVDDYVGGLNGNGEKVTIGLPKQYLSDANDPEMAAAIDNAVAVYRDAGAEVVEVDLPHTEYGIPAYYIVATAEASSNLARYDGVHYGHRTETPDDLIDLYSQSRAEGFGPEVKRRIMLGTYALSSGYYDAYYLRALKVRRLIKNDFDAAFEKVDAILCPTATGAAFKIGENSDDPLAMYMNDVYTVNANLAGIPGVSLPAGFAQLDGKKLPLGVQLFANVFEEAKLLRIAYLFQQATDYHRQRPTL